jgi:hypothetical protein
MLKQACFSRLMTPDAPWLDPLDVSVSDYPASVIGGYALMTTVLFTETIASR